MKRSILKIFPIQSHVNRFLVFFVCLGLILLNSCTERHATRAIDELMQNYVNRDEFSGTVLISWDGKIIYEKAFGYADRSNKIPNDLNTQFMLSSASKVLTGVAVLKLVQENRLSLDDPIGKFFQNITNGDQITIHRLLTHSSGLTQYYDRSDFSYEGIKTCNDMLRFIEGQQTKFAPGDSTLYSTSGMILLGAVIEKVTGKSFPEFVEESILVPVGMNHTSFKTNKDIERDSLHRQEYALGYVKSDSGTIQKHQSKYDFVTLSAGGMRSSITDLYKLDQALHTNRLLNKKHKALMFQKYVQTLWSEDWWFGYSWVVQHGEKPFAVGHPGTSLAYNAAFFRYPDARATIILLTNYGFANVMKMKDEIEKILFEP